MSSFQILGLTIGTIAMTLSSYIGLKHGLLIDKFGRSAAQRKKSPLIFWTLWGSCTLAAIVGWGVIGMAVWHKY
jgi:hypothetical protein